MSLKLFIFNSIYVHQHLYLKNGASRNGLSPGYSERNTGSVYSQVKEKELTMEKGILLTLILKEEYWQQLQQLKGMEMVSAPVIGFPTQ